MVVGTGLGPTAVDAYVRDHPALSVLTKPFRLEELAAHIARRLQAASAASAEADR